MTQAILIVEDDPDGQALVSHVVEHLNISYDVVDNAERALELLQNSGKDYFAAIIDLALPGKDGWELVSEIRNSSFSNDILCVAITAFHTSKTRADALNSGFNAYFSKPLNAERFAQELGAIL